MTAIKSLVALVATTLVFAARAEEPAPKPVPIPPQEVVEAALNGKIETIEKALAQGYKVDTRDPGDRTALMYAAFNGQADIVKKLIAAGADVNARDKGGSTALMFAASGPFAETVKLLLDNGAKIDTIDGNEHFTALMWAAAEGQAETVALLLKRGADASLRDIDGDTAESFAAQKNHTAVVKILQEASAPVDLLAGGMRVLSVDKRMAGNTESPQKDVLVFKKAGKYSGEMRIQFTVEDPAQFAALALRKPSSIRPVSLNGKPIPLPLEGMSYKTIPGIPASLLAPGTNELLLAWTQTVKSSTPKTEEGAPPAKPVMRPAKLSAAKIDVQLLGQTPSALAFQTGPVLGHAGETFFTVSCRVTLPAEVVLDCNGRKHASAPALLHIFKVEGLKPATTYSYSLHARLAPQGKDLVSTPEYTTRTLPASEPFTFAALGDSRTHPQDWAKVGAAVAKAKPAFSVFVGDMVTAGRIDEQWDEQYFDPAKDYFATVPYYPIIGNHEQNAPLYLKLFQTPGGETTWSQMIGPVLLVGIDGGKDWSKDSSQTKWLEGLLAKTAAKYVFLFSHYPAWTSGGHGGLNDQGLPKERTIREAQTVLMPLLKKYNATAMIAGHDHFYERSEPTNGVTMLISGGAGAPLRGKAKGAEKQNPHSKVFASQLHYCLFSVTAETCTMQVLTPEGEVVDTRQWPARTTK